MLLDILQRRLHRILVKASIEFFISFFSWLLIFLLIAPSPERAITVFKSVAGSILLYSVIRLGIFRLFRLLSSIWRYSGIYSLINIILASSICTVLFFIYVKIFSIQAFTNLAIITNWIIVIMMSGMARLFLRLIFERYYISRKTIRQQSDRASRILIYGAGRAGELLLRNAKNTPLAAIDVVGFIDDDPLKKGQYIHNKPVLGTGQDVAKLVNKYRITEIFFSIASLSGAEARRIIGLIKSQVGHKVELKIIPGLRDILNSSVSFQQLRQIEIKDLLRRKPVQLDFTRVEQMIKGSDVIVVGGGGSIGSELCRQIITYNPASLIIFDMSEYSLYTIDQQLKNEFPDADIRCIAGDCGNEELVTKVFETHRPKIVFHAAAYKHVPMMEYNPWSAIHNNLRATLTLARVSDRFNIKKFVLISTDKAVNPTNVMGATKRICEKIVLSYSRFSDTEFMMVRFGNVLGSSGSVIPKFKQQIESGGPITVTHKDVTRYFMLIPEAVELVLQAGAIGQSGNVYVLDMGNPIKINDIAKLMVELSGLTLGEDIEIEYSGLRPGEKLYEELNLAGEETATDIPGLLEISSHELVGQEYIEDVIDILGKSFKLEHNELRDHLKKMVPEFTPYIIEDKSNKPEFLRPNS